MRGRKPKPTASQIAAGDPRKHGARKLKSKLATEPKATRGLPECPRHLKGRARAAWNFWAEELAAMSIDRRPDAMMLEGACVNYGRAVLADLIIDREGLMFEEWTLTENGEKSLTGLKTHPAIRISNAAWRQVRGFCSEFGLSPVARTRLAIEKKDSNREDLLAILSKPREQKKPKTETVQ